MAKNIMSLKRNDLDIRVSDTFNPVKIESSFKIATMQDSVEVKKQIPTAAVISETFKPIKLGGGFRIAGMTDSIEFDKVIETATIDTQNSKGYIYNKMYVLLVDDFRLRTDYSYSIVEEEIDSGRMGSIQLDLTQFKTIKEITIND